MWRKWLLGTFAALMVSGFAWPILAAPPAEDPEDERVFDFEGDTVEADYLKPDTGMVETVVRKERKSLITIRADFVDEIVRSAENI